MFSLAVMAMVQATAAVPPPALEQGIVPAPEPGLVFNPPLVDPEPPAYIAEFAARVEQAAKSENMVGLAVAVLEQGRPVYVFTGGETAAGSGDLITADTAFRAASVSKSFTGTLLAMLEHDGAIDLDVEVPREILRLSTRTNPTWLDVFSHQTGLPPNAYDNLIEAGRDPGQSRARLAEVDLVCRPGDCYTYQNLAFSVAEILIEDATGLSYQSAVEHYIFEPYGMWTASLGTDALQASESWARPHRGWNRRRDRPGDPESNYDSLPSAAGINLSLNDLIRWAQIHLEPGRGVPYDVRDRVWTPYVDSMAETRRLWRYRSRVNRTAYGLGWRLYKWGDRELMMHSGRLSGYGAQIVMEPTTGFAFVALWNADANAPWRLWPTIMDLRTGDGPGDWLDDLD